MKFFDLWLTTYQINIVSTAITQSALLNHEVYLVE